MHLSKNTYKTRQNENGNVFLIILLGVALFAALAYTVTRGMRSDNTSRLSGHEATLAASDLLDFSGKLERAVSRVRRKNVSENDISFDNNFETGYEHTPAQPDNHKVFHKSGGNASWNIPANSYNDGSPWHITGRTCIPDIGTGGANCNADGEANEELLLVLPNIKDILCQKINDRLGISGIPTDMGGGYSTVKFTGTFSDSTKISIGGAYDAACYSDGTNNHFYAVLMER